MKIESSDMFQISYQARVSLCGNFIVMATFAGEHRVLGIRFSEKFITADEDPDIVMWALSATTPLENKQRVSISEYFSCLLDCGY